MHMEATETPEIVLSYAEFLEAGPTTAVCVPVWSTVFRVVILFLH